MSTLTTLLSLTKPDGGDAAQISVINANMDILDNAVTLTGTQSLTNKTLTSPHMTTPVVDSGGLTVTAGGATVTAGGLTVTAGGLIVTAGNVALGATLNAYIGLNAAPSLSGNNNQYGVISQPTGSSSGTTELVGFWSQPNTAATAYTVTSAVNFHATGFIKGAGSTITSAYGLLVDSLTQGGTNNYGIYINAPSGGSTINAGIVNLGDYLPADGTTNATAGFIYIPTGAGSPSGTPTLRAAARSPLYYDSTNHKLWVYESAASAWKGVVLS